MSDLAKAWVWGIAALIAIGLAWLVASRVLYVAQTGIDAQVQEVVRPTQINDFDTRMERSAQFNTRYRSLQATKASLQGVDRQIADLKALYGDDLQAWPLDKKDAYGQLLTTRQQYETAYNAACGAYQAAWDDEFQATAAPKDLPRTCDLI